MANEYHLLTSNILQRVMKIEVGAATATAFTMEVDSRQYLITAKHVMAAAGSESEVTILLGGQRKKIAVKVLRCPDPNDIAVLVPTEQLTTAFDLHPADGGVIFSQDVFFVGYPFGDDTLATQIEDLSVGFVRKATFAAQERGDGSWVRFYLDGTNNQGFSGGPVVYHDMQIQGHPLKIMGVISGYRNDFGEVFRIDPIEKAAVTPEDRAAGLIVDYSDGRTGKFVGTQTYVKNNTGIVVAYGIKAAVDLIKSANVLGVTVQ